MSELSAISGRETKLYFQSRQHDGGVTCGAATIDPFKTHEFTPGFSRVSVSRSLVLYVCFVDRCLSFFFWPLCYLTFFDLRQFWLPLWHLQTFLYFVVCWAESTNIHIHSLGLSQLLMNLMILRVSTCA